MSSCVPVFGGAIRITRHRSVCGSDVGSVASVFGIGHPHSGQGSRCVRGGLELLGFGLSIPSADDIGDAACGSAVDVSQSDFADRSFVVHSAMVHHAAAVVPILDSYQRTHLRGHCCLSLSSLWHFMRGVVPVLPRSHQN